MPRRLAFCITELDAGGAERALVDLVTRLDPAEWERRVFCLGPEGVLAAPLREKGIDVECFGARKVQDISVLKTLTRSLREYRPDVLQTFLFHANVLGRLAGRRANVPVIVSGLRVAERQKRWHVWLDRATGVQRYHAVCVSSGVAEFARDRLKIPPEKIHVIRNGVDFRRFADAAPLPRAELGLPDRSKLIVAIGRLHRQKGFDVLIEAATPLLKEQHDLFLVIAGEGPERVALQSRIDEAGLSAQVQLIGRCERIPELLQAADLFVLSSRWEGMPNVLLEAMAAGTPVLATRVEGASDLMQLGALGRLVEPGSVAELRLMLQFAITHPELPTNSRSSAQRFVEEHLTLSAVASAYATLYRRLLADVNS